LGVEFWVVGLQKCLVEFGVFGEWGLVVVGLGMGSVVAVGEVDYVVGSVGAVFSHKDTLLS